MISLSDPLQVGNSPDHFYCAIFFRKKKTATPGEANRLKPPFPECAGFSSPLPWRGWPLVTGKYIYDHSKVLELLNTRARNSTSIFLSQAKFSWYSEIFDAKSPMIHLFHFNRFFQDLRPQNLIPKIPHLHWRALCSAAAKVSSNSLPTCTWNLREMTQVGIMPRIIRNVG